MVTRFLFVCIICLWTSSSFTQTPPSQLVGHWRGSFIKVNSSQDFQVRFYEKDGQLQSLQIMEEWHPQFGEFVLPVTIDSTNLITFRTGIGAARMRLDTAALELNGTLTDQTPTTYVHLKKIPDPPTPTYTVEAVRMRSGNDTLGGYVHRPKYAPSRTAIIIVGGRGCWTGSPKFDLYAKLLRDYNVTVLAYDKRGTGQSSGDCATATLDDLAEDVVTIRDYLRRVYPDLQHIGALGSSAGGWVVARAAELTELDFLITVVGPATSVRDQQLQSMDYGLREYKLPANSRDDLRAYTELMLDAPVTPDNFARMQALLKNAKVAGWDQLLDDTDVPADVDAMDQLWVRRHAYDPARSWRQFDGPVLAVFGERDWIVPLRENTERLRSFFPNGRTDQLHIVIAPEGGHSTEAPDQWVKLTDDHRYYRFFRVSPVLSIEVIQFLRKWNYMD